MSKPIWLPMDTPTVNEIQSIITDLITEYYPVLSREEPEFILTFRNGPTKTKGVKNYSKCEPIPEKYSEHMEGDLLLWVDHKIWNATDEKTHTAIIHHALAYIYYSDDGGYKERSPDIHEFSEVIALHGFWNTDLKIAEHRIANSQLELFPTRAFTKEPNIKARAMKPSEEIAQAVESLKGTEITFHGDPNGFAGKVAQEMKNQGLDVKGFDPSDKSLEIARKLKAVGAEFVTGES